MGAVLKSSWALLLGIFLLMVGNGVQGTLLGIRGQIEGFTPLEMSIVISAYFVGFLGGSRLAPEMIRKVGHLRVFAALGSLISAVLILYPVVADPLAWTVLRVVIGFCFSGVYVTAESWLNNSTPNETRGQVLSAYMIVQMAGIIAAQQLLVGGDPAGYELFIIPSVLVSLSFAPILLAAVPTPPFERTKPMRLVELYRVLPLGFVGMAILGSIFAAQFGMAAVFGTLAGLSVARIASFVSAFYIGALILQYPLGWVSDRVDRRVLIALVALSGALAAVVAALSYETYAVMLAAAFLIGGTSNPLYSLLIAYTNDYLESDDMAAASGGLVFINGLGAIAGPLVLGWMMERFGPATFFLFLAGLLGGIAVYAAWRMTRRPAPESEGAFAPVPLVASPVIVEAVQEYVSEVAQEAEAEAAEEAAMEAAMAAEAEAADERAEEAAERAAADAAEATRPADGGAAPEREG